MKNKPSTMQILTQLAKVKKAGTQLAFFPEQKINKVLKDLARALIKEQKFILAANQKDLKEMEKSSRLGNQDPKYDRLKLTEERLKSIAADLLNVAKLPSPINKILEQRTRPNGLKLTKITVPLGVVGIIYEARPNVTVDVFSLCFKSGNACVLKGGSEAANSNQALIKIIQKVLSENKIDKNIVTLLPNDRAALTTVLQAHQYIDVLIPRGGQGLINFVRENAKVPVIETGAGIVHTFFDETADLKTGREIILNAKTRRVSVCNALDTLIIHEKRLHDLPALVAPLANLNVEIFADQHAYKVLSKYPSKLLHHAATTDFDREFLDYKMAIKTVANLDQALAHIAEHSSKHSEAIISKNKKNIERFLTEVDAACVYANTSTAFSDGGQFGMGAEIGISTQKLHARGPMALPELTSYKWIIRGSGQIRS